ncbi:hypothetical protein TWF481_002302 [Arthrobotrys musiformis]|uniref:F-box domain-containing protein n=1 Tax=Arthrobotrys musiformis TaxID=47236 RepID=A0AAV9VU04_9PEZI
MAKITTLPTELLAHIIDELTITDPKRGYIHPPSRRDLKSLSHTCKLFFTLCFKPRMRHTPVLLTTFGVGVFKSGLAAGRGGDVVFIKVTSTGDGTDQSPLMELLSSLTLFPNTKHTSITYQTPLSLEPTIFTKILTTLPKNLTSLNLSITIPPSSSTTHQPPLPAPLPTITTLTITTNHPIHIQTLHRLPPLFPNLKNLSITFPESSLSQNDWSLNTSHCTPLKRLKKLEHITLPWPRSTRSEDPEVLAQLFLSLLSTPERDGIERLDNVEFYGEWVGQDGMLYDNRIIISYTKDRDGKWEYEFDGELIEGEEEVFGSDWDEEEE